MDLIINGLLLFEQRDIIVYEIYYYMSAIRVFYMYVGYIFILFLFVYGQNICTVFELRLFLYLEFLKWLLLVPSLDEYSYLWCINSRATD